MVGELTDDTLGGWWTELPDRMEPDGAGRCTFVFEQTDGVWRATGTWEEGGESLSGWDLERVDGDIPDGVMTVLADDAQFLDGR